MDRTTRTISIDLKERKAEGGNRWPVTVSTETPVQRRDLYTGEMFDEVLSHKSSAVDLSRAPLPVIESHDRSKVNVGIVENLRVEGGRLRGELVLGKSARALELSADVDAGIVTGLSVGYLISKESRDEKAKRVTATRWMPFEVSIVSVPADVSAGINRSKAMDETNTPDAAQQATTVERSRVTGILTAVRAAKLGDDLAREMISNGTSIEAARTLVLERLAAKTDAVKTDSHVRSEDLAAPRRGSIEFSQRGDHEDFVRAASEGLCLRAGVQVKDAHAAARDLEHSSIFDIARTSLSRANINHSRMSQVELIKRAATTSDFPKVLSGSLHAALRNGYETEPSSHRAWVRPVPVSDFRIQERPILGSMPALDKVLEHGEYEQGRIDEDSTSYQISKFGRIVALSWETLVNDRLNAFLRVQPGLGQAARRAEADLIYGLLAANSGAGPTMQDSVVLFHATHGNLASSGAFSAATIAAGRALLRKQTALGGGYLSLVPRFLIVPAELETSAEMLLASATRVTSGTTESDRPEWMSRLELVVEPRLPSTACYLAADSGQIDTVEMGLLEENFGGPTFEEDHAFTRDQFSWKVRHVFGAAALDWRGLVKIPLS